MSMIVCENLTKIYKSEELEVIALQGLDLVVDPGELIAVVGASGSGKSTLQNVLAAVDEPTAGRALVADHDLTNLSRRQRTAYRRDVVGFVVQQTTRNLLPYLSAIENVELPQVLAGRRGNGRRERAGTLLELVGLSARADASPAQLSGGEQQRVAIAAALANQPQVLLADEPTGELDSATATEVFAVLRDVNQALGVTVVVLTHDPLVSGRVDRTVAIRDGRTATETLRRSEEGALAAVEEFAVLDRSGRLQIPDEYVTALGLHRRVRLGLRPEHIEVRRGDDAAPAAAAVVTALAPADLGAGSVGEEEMRRVAPGTPIVEAVGLTRRYDDGGGAVEALRGVDLHLAAGELVVVQGRSGAGKSTLLNLVGGLDRPTTGTVAVGGTELTTLDDDALAEVRRTQIGFVFQSFGLLEVLTAAENVEVPLRLAQVAPAARDRRVNDLLSVVGLADRATHRPSELSGGQQQRVAVARALAGQPLLLIADEPTGQLDSLTARRVMELLRTVVDGVGVAALVATHDQELVNVADRVLELRDGQLR